MSKIIVKIILIILGKGKWGLLLTHVGKGRWIPSQARNHSEEVSVYSATCRDINGGRNGGQRPIK